ncbi:MAG TPA: (E)-4-hydroxy-3-methylbut-2-enyl-diphosphate synthase [Opitutaceae bacterium]|nr:(E)-4-hydroxy-3-methylbut-2-enyl-diphosphate synthase [Opitutaceae bacterium]
MAYCASRFQTIRRRTVEVKVGAVGVGGDHPIRLQSMTTSDTQDVAATVRQCIALAEVGCEIVRVTAPNVPAAQCLRAIRDQFTAAGFGAVPLVADIHFLPSAAMEAVEHVEKVRVNPGNYADKKKFAVREYSDADYARELERLRDAFTPLVRRCRELGRALRIGTNHGSLSDRIMNRYGDTPLGMVESALEFVRIAEAEGFHDLILSMKASNPKVMIQAYRLLVERMDAAHRPYPLHLGVTEAGDGEDGRIKGAIGIGALLLDGLGDTIRVSLTEDSVYEIPVARAIADRAMSRWTAAGPGPAAGTAADAINPFEYTRRETSVLPLSDSCVVGPEHPPRVIVRVAGPAALAAAAAQLAGPGRQDTPVEGLLVPVADTAALAALRRALTGTDLSAEFLVLELGGGLQAADLEAPLATSRGRLVLLRTFRAGDGASLDAFARLVRRHGQLLAVDSAAEDLAAMADVLRRLGDDRLLFTLGAATGAPPAPQHRLGAYRRLAHELSRLGCRAPVWIRNTAAGSLLPDASFLGRLIDASFLTGGLLCDGVGDLVSVETEPDAGRALKLAYNLLQGAGARFSKTEFVACPSCGRTLFDLQTTTQRIREKTGHLKGVKIAIMGCIVNGPGEMADADFGYVGGAPGKINLYVGKACVQYNLPQAEADDRLIALIKEHGKWLEPAAAAETAAPR